jgi:hypothetical protein
VLDEGAARNLHLQYLLGVQLEYDPPTAALPNESMIRRLCMHGPRNDRVVAVKGWLSFGMKSVSFLFRD